MRISARLLLCLIPLFAISIFAQTDTEKGVELYRNGKYDEAISVLENVVKANENEGIALTYLGACLVYKRNDKEALKVFNQAFSIKVSSETAEIFDETVKITAKQLSNYTDKARKNSVEGTINVAVEFKENGKLGFVFPLNFLPDGLTEQAIKAARKIKFKPASKKGKPVTIVKYITYWFKLY